MLAHPPAADSAFTSPQRSQTEREEVCLKDWAATTPLAATRKLWDTFVDLQHANAGKIDGEGRCPVRQADLGTSSEASKLSSWQRVLEESTLTLCI